MNTVEEIEKAIEQLPTSDIWRLDEWFVAFRNRRWDEQMEADAESGRLDQLWEKARVDIDSGQTKSLDDL